MTKEYKQTKGITIRLTEEEHYYLKKLALENKTTVSNMISIILKEYKNNQNN